MGRDLRPLRIGSGRVSRDASGKTTAQPVRAPDGYWYAGTHWQHRNVSGVLISHRLLPWTVSSEVLTLWEHPDPEYPVSSPNIWRRAIPMPAGTVSYTNPEVAPGTLFGLSATWPGF